METIAQVRQKYPQYEDMSDADLAKALHNKFYKDVPEAEFNAKIGFNPAKPSNDDEPDTSGAPASIRALVGSMPDANARLQAMRKYAPDAEPHGDDNFVYTDPKTGRVTLYNPEGFDMGDIASLAPEAGEFVGGVVGAITGGTAGTAVAPGVGTVAGAIGGAGLGGTAGREAVQRAAMVSAGVDDKRSAGQQAKDAATTFVLNAGGQGVGMAAGAGIRAGIRGLARGGKAGMTATQKAIADLNRFGATPSVAQATQNPGLDGLESLVAKVPGGAGVIRTAAQKQSETVAASVAAKLKNLNSNIAPNTLAAGAAATKGVDDFVTGRFGDKAAALYDKLDTFIPSDTVVPVKNTERVLAEIVTPAKGAVNTSKALANSKLAAIQDALGKDASNGAVTYPVLKDLRSAIGRRLGSPSLTDDIPRAELKRVYGALTDDLRFAAQEKGPEAVKAFDRASKYYKAGMDRIETMLEPMVRGKLPEQVFASLEASGKQGPTRLRALRQSVSNDQWRVVAASVADRMGKAKAGQQGVEVENFSFQTFLTNWQKLDPAARDVLFSGPNMKGIRGDLDALARASERIRDSSKAFANPSGTAGASAGVATVFGATGSLAMTDWWPMAVVGAAMTGSHGTAKLLTSPKFVKWLAQSTKVKPSGIGPHISRLGVIAAESDPETRDAIKGYLDTLAGPQEQ